MAPARSPAVDAASGRRHQPARQARTNPHRATHGNSSRRDSVGSPATGQAIEIFPGVTHFADAIAALPKELVRHLTLLKEVDAKSSAPEQHLQDLVQACLDSSLPQPKTNADAASTSSPGATTPHSAALSAPNSTSTSTLAPNLVRSVPATDEAYQAAIYDQANTPRRQLFLSTAARIKDMLMSLDEKNHVICTANEVLQRQMSRIEDIWPHLEGEFSEEAKWGSTTHWAYPENRMGKPAGNERSRRDGQSSAAQQAAEEAAARSDARKQAVQAKKNQRNQAQDDGEGGKRSHGGKNRKTADNSGSVGLGISGGAANGATNPPSKRRKVEKPVNGGGAGSERAMSSVFGNVSKARATTSPRATPVPEGQKKRKALPSGPAQAKKSRNGAVSATSSPVLGAFPDGKNSARNSPVPGPTSTPKLGSSRSKPNTSQPPEAGPNANGANSASTNNGSKARPPSSASTKANGTAPETPDAAALNNGPRLVSEPKTAAEQGAVETRGSATPMAPADEVKEDKNTGVPSSKKEGETPKLEEADKKGDPRPTPGPMPTPGPAAAALTPAAPTPTTVTTKSGRASKPSTPALATFQEAAAARPRSSRDSKRSHHKKSASQSNSTAAPRPAPPPGGGARNGAVDEEEEDVDVDADELTYCYCNSVSYGAMVACDSDDCEREWFHLECVGLKVPPKQNVKWYCEDCKKRMKMGEKKSR